MKNIALLLALSLIACGKKGEDKGGGGAATPTATDDKPAAEPTTAPVKTTPQALFAEFSDPKADGMTLLNKYGNGATFSGKVAVKGAEETGKPILWIDLDGKNHMSLDYTDVAQAKAVKDGETVTVTCKIGGGERDVDDGARLREGEVVSARRAPRSRSARRSARTP